MSEGVNWDLAVDVLVLGFGGAGSCAAIEARDAGADVLVIDAFDGGGATALSGGIVYSGGGTRQQREAGVEDDAEEMFKYLSLEVGDAVSPATLRRFCDQSVGNLRWLEANGVGFQGSFHKEKTSYPPEDKYLYYSGNEAISGYREHAKPAPRGHRTLGKGWTGYRFFGALQASALGKGVRFRSFCRAIRLIQDGTGRVIGVEARDMAHDGPARRKLLKLKQRVSPFKPFNGTVADDAVAQSEQIAAELGKPLFIRAAKAVIVATGGFINDMDLLARHAPTLHRNRNALLRMGSLGCNGSGIAMGQAIGGATRYMDSLFIARNVSPPDIFLQGILVNGEGERIINEESYAGFVGNAISKQPGGSAWLIVSEQMYRRGLWQTLRSGANAFRYYAIPVLLNLFLGGTRRGRNVEELAKRCGIDGLQLARTLSEHNAGLRQGKADEMGKSDRNRALVEGPCRAINMSISNKYGFTMCMTLGGLRVDEQTGSVLDSRGAEIPGLYAAGRAAVGLCSVGYFSGMSLADCVFSGRRAGAAALARSTA